MKVSGTYLFNAPAPRVWDALMDPKKLAGCIPGCQDLSPVGDGEYQAVLSVGVGPIRGQYNARISLRDQAPHQSYRLVIEGTGAPGFVNGEAVITLAEQGGQTTVQVDGDSQAGGAVVRVGQRMMGSVAKSMMDRFFNCLRQATG